MAFSSAPAADDAGVLRLGPSTATRCLVLLHGWGADADDLLELGTLLAPADTGVVALQAPLPHPAGVGRQWYDLQQPGWPQLAAARRDLHRRLLKLASEIPLERTVLLGFSQGAAMALDVATSGDGLAAERPGLAGLVGCSGYPHPAWQPKPPGGTPVLLTHGEGDPVVPAAASADLERRLQAAAYPVERLAFAGGHSIDASLFAPMRSFLTRCWS